MTTSPPPAWHWLDECEVPVQAYQWMGSKTPSDALLSFHSQEVPESDALRERNDSDQCSECRSAPGQPHAPGCDVSGSPVVSCDRKDDAPGCDGVCFGRETPTKLPTGAQNEHQSHRIGTCYYDPDTGETVMPPDFFGEKELRWKTDKDGNRHDGEPIRKVAEPPKCPVCLHEMESDEGVLCDYCEEPTGPGSFAVVNGPGGVFVYHLACYDEVYWGGQDAMDKGVDMNEEPAIETHEDLQGKDVDKTLDTLDSALDTLMEEGYFEMAGEWQGCEPEPARSAIGAGPVFGSRFDPRDPIPFRVQEWMFESLCEEMIAELPHLILTHSERIIEMARDRFRAGYAKYGSNAFLWDSDTRIQNVLEELADSIVYLTSGSVE